MTAPQPERESGGRVAVFGPGPGAVWLDSPGSPYVGEGPELFAVVETNEGSPVRLVRAVGGFDTFDRAEEWAGEYLGGTYAVIPFEIASGSAAGRASGTGPHRPG